MGWNDHIDLDPTLFWDIEDKFVCIECLYDDGLKVFVSERQPPAGEVCSYCSGRSRSIPVSVLQGHIRNYFPYGRAEEELPLDPDPGETYFGQTWDPWDALDNFLGMKVSDELFEDFRENLVDQLYCQANWASLPLDAQWKGQWKEFQQAVRHEAGVFSLSIEVPHDERNHDEPHPAFFNNAIAAALLRADAVSVLESETKIQRVQQGHVVRTFDRLTCPPAEKAGRTAFHPKGFQCFMAQAISERLALRSRQCQGLKLPKASSRRSEIWRSSTSPQPSFLGVTSIRHGWAITTSPSSSVDSLQILGKT